MTAKKSTTTDPTWDEEELQVRGLLPFDDAHVEWLNVPAWSPPTGKTFLDTLHREALADQATYFLNQMDRMQMVLGQAQGDARRQSDAYAQLQNHNIKMTDALRFILDNVDFPDDVVPRIIRHVLGITEA